jgi:hypothetical protein
MTPSPVNAPVRSMSEVYDLLAQIESQLDLGAFSIAGVDVWPYVRDHFVIEQGNTLKATTTDRFGYLARLWSKLRALPAGLPELWREGWPWRADLSSIDAGRAEVLILTDVANKRFLLSGAWFDVFVDPVLDALKTVGVSACVLETAQGFLHRPSSQSPRRSIAAVMVREYVRALVRSWSVEVPERCQQEHRLYQLAMERLGLGHLTVPLAVLRLEATYVRQLTIGFSALLRRVQPRLILAVPASGYSGRALCIAARNAGIPVADIQHGRQGPHFPTYAAHDHMPSHGYNVLPTHVLNWSESDRQVIARWADRGTVLRPRVVGMLLMERFRTDSSLVRHFDRSWTDAFGDLSGRRIVLISLQWGAYLPANIEEAMRLSPADVLFQVRLHPATKAPERRAVQRRLEQAVPRDRWEIDSASTLPLPALLRWCDLHVTQSSSTVIEAERFGVRSIITSSLGVDFYPTQLAAGTVHFEPKATGIALRIRNLPVAEPRVPRLPSADVGLESIEDVILDLMQAGARIRDCEG